jgi:putative transposase
MLFFLSQICYHSSMPRKARIDAPGALHHIIVRGIEGRKIFRDDSDRKNFLDRLADLIPKTRTRCFAWALLPNHAHLLLQTGLLTIASLMRRLLTGYAVSFNLKYHRHGHLFQNRYKSILCQEDAYLKELVRYIHLNPLRAGMLPGLESLDRYPWAGHSVVMGKINRVWQDTEYVLAHFGDTRSKAQSNYRSFIEKGIPEGKRPDLIGGGLIRSAGGWHRVSKLRKAKLFMKSDERILGDGEFVEEVLKQADDRLDRRYEMRAKGLDFDGIVQRVAHVLKIRPADVLKKGKEPQTVKARNVLCYWATRELDMTTVEVAKRLRICQSSVSRGALRGEAVVADNMYRLDQEEMTKWGINA